MVSLRKVFDGLDHCVFAFLFCLLSSADATKVSYQVATKGRHTAYAIHGVELALDAHDRLRQPQFV
jgi:hypothetical protein